MPWNSLSKLSSNKLSGTASLIPQGVVEIQPATSAENQGFYGYNFTCTSPGSVKSHYSIYISTDSVNFSLANIQSIGTSFASISTAVTTFGATLVGLTPGTLYYVYLVIRNTVGSVNYDTRSAAMQFTTRNFLNCTGGSTTTKDVNGYRYKLHAFTSSSTFTINTSVTGNFFRFAVIGGGGGGGGKRGGGGGGGGASIWGYGGQSYYQVNASTTTGGFTVEVGAGGGGGVYADGSQGGYSRIPFVGGGGTAVDIYGYGGGGGGDGGNYDSQNPQYFASSDGGTGACGGGAGGNWGNYTSYGGSASSEGYVGGNGVAYGDCGGGGGGRSQVGGAGNGYLSAKGGDGIQDFPWTNITGILAGVGSTPRKWGAGGGGGGFSYQGASGNFGGGPGAAGYGEQYYSYPAGAGGNGSFYGAGGGGGSNYDGRGGDGHAGCVVIWYITSGNTGSLFNIIPESS